MKQTYSLPVYVSTVESATPNYNVPYSQTLKSGTITIVSDADKKFEKLTINSVDYKLAAPYTTGGVKVSKIEIDVATGKGYAVTWSGYTVPFATDIVVGSGQITAKFSASCITVLTAADCTYEAEGWHQIFPGRGSEQGVNDFYAGELGGNGFCIRNAGESSFAAEFKYNGHTMSVSVPAAGYKYIEFNGALHNYNGAVGVNEFNTTKIETLQMTNETIPEGITYYVK